MDPHGHDQHQNDFLSTIFCPDGLNSGDGAQQQHQDVFSSSMNSQNVPFQQASTVMPSGNMIEDILGMQGMDVQQSQQGMPQPQGQTQYTPQMVLEQQLLLAKLQQVQQLQNQLQNQIFQQQLELLGTRGMASMTQSGSSSDSSREPQSFHGLPTPLASGDLRPASTNEFVSPMFLHFQPTEPPRETAHPASQFAHTHLRLPVNYVPNAAHSAPANIVFDTSSPMGLTSPGDLEFELSSPWFGVSQGQSRDQQQQSYPSSSSSSSVPNKRTASPSGDEASSSRPSRKRSSQVVRPAVSGSSSSSGTKKPSSRATKSASSTPLLKGSCSRRGSTATRPEDTPSPVDLSMPPPAPPSQVGTSSFEASGSPPANSPVNIVPVTPASIMNLGRLGLGSGLAPPPISPSTSGSGNADNSQGGTSKTRQGAKSTAGEGSRQKKDNVVNLQSPGLKPIRPAGGSSLNATSITLTQPVPQVRKTSHKAAEQKRRDSLKTTFDDLRLLLPPIPMPSAEGGVVDETILPGAMPPRGPPKGEGPNRHVSKLQLLRCGNDYIRRLNGRIERRNDEIAALRNEVRRLRGLLGDDSGLTGGDGCEELDLDKDLDTIEAINAAGLGTVLDGDEADEDDYET